MSGSGRKADMLEQRVKCLLLTQSGLSLASKQHPGADCQDARRQRIIISQSEVGPVKWAAILLMGLCALIAIAIVHSDNRLTCAIAVALFATGLALSSLLIAAYSRPFTGEISVKPELLQDVVPSETATSHTTSE